MASSASLARDTKLLDTVKLPAATLNALEVWFRKTWAMYSRNTLYITDAPSVSSIKQLSYESSEVTYPLAILAPAGFQLDTDKAGLRQRFTPIVGAKDFDTKRANLYRMTPVKVGYGLQFRTNDIDEATLFLTMIYQSSPGPSLVLQSAESGFSFQSRVSFPSDLDIANNNDPNDYFSIDMSIVYSSWVGVVEEVGLIDNLVFKYRMFDQFSDFSITYDQELQEYLPPVEIEQKLSYTDSFDKNSPNYASASYKDITGD